MSEVFTGVIMFFVGFHATTWLLGFTESNYTLPKSAIAECAVVERPVLRNTTGVATFVVTFRDGEYQEITCRKPEAVEGQGTTAEAK